MSCACLKAELPLKFRRIGERDRCWRRERQAGCRWPPGWPIPDIRTGQNGPGEELRSEPRERSAGFCREKFGGALKRRSVGRRKIRDLIRRWLWRPARSTWFADRFQTGWAIRRESGFWRIGFPWCPRNTRNPKSIRYFEEMQFNYLQKIISHLNKNPLWNFWIPLFLQVVNEATKNCMGIPPKMYRDARGHIWWYSLISLW